MRCLISLLLLVLCVNSVPASIQQSKESKERAKQEQRERKEADKRARSEYAAHLNAPSTETFPVSPDVAGLLISEIAVRHGYTFAGYQPATAVFGAQTAQMALYTTPANWKESFQLGLTSPVRTTGGAVKYLAFSIIGNNSDQTIINGRIGIMTGTYGGYFYLDKMPFLDYRSELNAIIITAKNAAETRQAAVVSNQVMTLEAYQKISIGMSYAEVSEIMGKGKLLSETETASLKVAEYEWAAVAGKISMTFENDKLSKKSQTGLQSPPSTQSNRKTESAPSQFSQSVESSDRDKEVTVYWIRGTIFYHQLAECPRSSPAAKPISLADVKKAGAHPCSQCVQTSR